MDFSITEYNLRSISHFREKDGGFGAVCSWLQFGQTSLTTACPWGCGMEWGWLCPKPHMDGWLCMPTVATYLLSL